MEQSYTAVEQAFLLAAELQKPPNVYTKREIASAFKEVADDIEPDGSQ